VGKKIAMKTLPPYFLHFCPAYGIQRFSCYASSEWVNKKIKKWHNIWNHSDLSQYNHYESWDHLPHHAITEAACKILTERKWNKSLHPWI